jgi:hypothetical protein
VMLVRVRTVTRRTYDLPTTFLDDACVAIEYALHCAHRAQLLQCAPVVRERARMSAKDTESSLVDRAFLTPNGRTDACWHCCSFAI